MSYCKESYLFLQDLEKKFNEKVATAEKQRTDLELKIKISSGLQSELEIEARVVRELENEIKVMRKIIEEWKNKLDRVLENK